MVIVHCDRCNHWTGGLYEIPNTDTGVADKYCGSCLPKETPETLPDELKDKYDQFVLDVQNEQDKPSADTYDDDDEDEDW